MKTADLIVQYLYSNKSLTLQDIGSFTLSDDLHLSAENDKETALPPDAIQFTYNQRAKEDDGLVAYIMEQTGKIRPLAASDLESYVMLNKQFLNIGKPLNIDGVGTLLKTQNGEYAFTQAGSSHIKTHDAAPRSLKEKLNEEKNISFSTPAKEKSGKSKTGLIALILAVLIGGSIAAYFIINRQHKKEVVAEETAPITDTLPAANTNPDTTKAKAAIPAPAVKDTNSFYLVIHRFDNLAAAQKDLERLNKTGDHFTLFAEDSAAYKIRIPFNRPLADTSVVRDSIFKSKFFRIKMTVDLPR